MPRGRGELAIGEAGAIGSETDQHREVREVFVAEIAGKFNRHAVRIRRDDFPHGDRHVAGGQAPVAVVHHVGEGVAAVKAQGWGVGGGRAVVCHEAVAGRGNGGEGQGVRVGIAVIGQQREGDGLVFVGGGGVVRRQRGMIDIVVEFHRGHGGFAIARGLAQKERGAVADVAILGRGKVEGLEDQGIRGGEKEGGAAGQDEVGVARQPAGGDGDHARGGEGEAHAQGGDAAFGDHDGGKFGEGKLTVHVQRVARYFLDDGRIMFDVAHQQVGKARAAGQIILAHGRAAG